ncbi:MAG: EAL domain-containing protein [Lachnospiraceae bacterium]|nr:EAL domain-containing protein [Lachnospiraceae bacterium]
MPNSYEGKEKGFAYESMVDRGKMQRLQDKFCEVTGICAYFVDTAGVAQTRLSGDAGDMELIKPYIKPEEISKALQRIGEGSLEELAIEETGAENLRLAAMAVGERGRLTFYWIAYCILEEEKPMADSDEAADGSATRSFGNPTGNRITGYRRSLTEKAFYQAMDLLYENTKTIFHTKITSVNAEMESMRSHNSELELKNSLDRLEVITQIVQLLDSDDAIETVMEKWLRVVGEYLDVTTGHIFQIFPDTVSADILAEWCKHGIVPPFDKNRNLRADNLVFSEKPVVISSDTIDSNALAATWKEYKVRALAMFPLVKSAGGSMCVCLNQSDRDRIWKVEEIKFIADAVKVLQNILSRRIQKNSLISSYASLEAILDNLNSCIYVQDMEGNPLFSNKKLKKTFERELEDGSLEKLLQSWGTQKAVGPAEIHYPETKSWYDMLHTGINWVDGRKAKIFVFYDITDKKIYQKKIEQQAYTDFLTGLYNRMCCERDLAWHVDSAKKNQEKGALLYLDLDDFKHINDGLGHQYGDVLLKAISNSLSRIDGIHSTCYRMGGDEFVIVIPPESYHRCEGIIKDIESVFEKPWFLKDADYYCTMSMGVVVFPDNGENVQELIKKADIAMYEAKKTGKNKVAYYSDGLGMHSGRRLDMEKNMRDATADGYREFEVYYQPIIDISLPGAPCTGAEALIRWNSMEMGSIPPSEFIPLAEYLGLINPIGSYVLLEACRECKRWNDNGHPGYKVNVNLSVVQLLQPDIVESVKEVLEETGIKPNNLTLEVTESLAINDMGRMKEILGGIKALGVRIALDDFGTGYSSLNHIREIPFDVIKVDQSFVKDLAEDAYSQSFIKMVAELAETIGVSICVEGIESEEQFKVLEGMKVRMIQGYYFDRPLPKEDFEKKYTNIHETA